MQIIFPTLTYQLAKECLPKINIDRIYNPTLVPDLKKKSTDPHMQA